MIRVTYYKVSRGSDKQNNGTVIEQHICIILNQSVF